MGMETLTSLERGSEESFCGWQKGMHEMASSNCVQGFLSIASSDASRRSRSNAAAMTPRGFWISSDLSCHHHLLFQSCHEHNLC